MPAILGREMWPLWPGEEPARPNDLLAMLRPYPAELMRAYPVDIRVGNVKNNHPELLAPITLMA